ncbi:MAG: SagB family peptide dehydrogenase [Proteobacteria bacterium]|nr:SagB family peptide dehydrogenase [Pseudomonadota bacterium]MBU1581811.1 SagB family peptide dehydrogenase [Pseudomonadota bacterium]MBU2454721.1 SagB family peptide dehydrogenase [Pseudomonadota bacterium]MBU2627755.1 SagB family peptide dehydrogenase [Pseudomonadota bacterium]
MDEGIITAKAYHLATNHIRHRITPHHLDFENYPVPFKSYAFLNKIDLIKTGSKSKVDLNLLFDQLPQAGLRGPLSLNALSQILLLAYGVTRTGAANGMNFYFRTTPSAGGLYPCHLYLLVRFMNGLETGLYYCNMIQEFLALIQRGENPAQEDKEVSFSFIITGEFYNSSWKYRERAFRYILLDSGHLMENLSLALNAFDQFFSIEYDFDDQKISQRLFLDNAKEVPLAIVTVGQDTCCVKEQIDSRPHLSGPRAEQKIGLSAGPSYPLLEKIYHLGGKPAQKKFVGPKQTDRVTKPLKKTIRLSDFSCPPDKIDYMETVCLRRSKRNFVPKVLDMTKAIRLLRLASSLPCSDAQAEKVDPCLTIGVSCQNIHGIEDGFYLFSQDRTSLHLIRKGQYHNALSRVCLDQQWIAHAAVNFLFMADLSYLETSFGPRGYRYLLMHSGRIAQRIYLGATGLGLGCCGVGALYDEEARDLFDLNEDVSLFYVVSTGPVKK